ncbi:MAG: sigma-70 family RNA polymerase sigma factor [Planctomycetaceae bacterium]|nr:sigma-70 family RNA polymerase sigma factor [Planctomycetaceae bacterium]
MNEPGQSDQRHWVLSLLEQYETRLVRYAARIMGDEDSARDVVQHVFLRLCERGPEETEGRVAQWLFTVCRNRAIDVLRKRKRTTQFEEGAVECQAGREAGPAHVAERHDLYLQLNRLVAALPTAQREAVDLWAEGFSYREISDITGEGEGKLRVLVHRALKRLRNDPVTQRMLGGVGGSDMGRAASLEGRVRS